MKTVLMSAVMLFSIATAKAQTTEALASNEENKTEAVAVAKKESAILLRNSAERPIAVYWGNKKEVFSGKSQSVGGLSKNTLHLFEGDIVCIMKEPKVIHACSIIKEGMDKVEINSAGTGFVK